MSDQATTLREIAGSQNTAPEAVFPAIADGNRIFTLAVTGGKGGVGKSNVAVNLAIELAALGRRVSLLDADIALANADLLCGVNPKFHLGHVLSGTRTLQEVIINVANGVRLIPGGSGIEELANLGRSQHQRFIAELSAMENESDFLLIDTPAGIGANVTSILEVVAAVIVVTTPDPTAVVDAYATIKVIHSHSPQKPISVIVNDVVGIGDAEETFSQIQVAVDRFLHHRLDHLGTVPRDAELAEAVRRQVPVVEYAPQTPASRSLRLIARQLEQIYTRGTFKRDCRPFWRSLVDSEFS